MKPEHGQTKIGLALAGGGVGGAIFEIGALKAINDALIGLDLNDIDIYVGVSAGSFLSSCLANDVTPDQLCRTVVRSEPGEPDFAAEIFLTPAIGGFLRRGLMVPRLFMEGLAEYIGKFGSTSLLGAMSRVLRALPTGVFDNEPMRRYLEAIFSMKGRSNDFRTLDRELYLVAADLDSGESVVFGSDGYEDIPISRAVQASTALPGLYPPALIDGRYYVDGVLLKTMHASVALRRGANLMLCLNPIVPVDTTRAVELGVMRRGKLFDRGLIAILSQSLRTMVHSRLTVGVAAYESRFENADVVLFEPKRDDYTMFFNNIFSFASRKAICEHAYLSTLADIRARRSQLEPILARHGVHFNDMVLGPKPPDLWRSLGVSAGSHAVAETTVRLESALRELERVIGDRMPASKPDGQAKAR